MTSFRVRHETVYSYARPVNFGEHRLMIRPRDSHALRLNSATLLVEPAAAVRWSFDVFGNSVARLRFNAPAQRLRIVSELDVQRYFTSSAMLEIDAQARNYPFVYSPADRVDLGGADRCHYPDPRGELVAYARSFVPPAPLATIDLLRAINASMNSGFSYARRDDEGTQAPLETLARGGGACRDFATLMVEVVRALGFGARFVTGYLHDPALDGAASGVVGSAATHAWLEIYLPGAGWIEFDPTNGLEGSEALIRVAVTRDASQAVPVAGNFTGSASDFQSLAVSVTVRQMELVDA